MGEEKPLPTDWVAVTDVPETLYAKTPDGLRIAYQVIGDGPINVLVTTPPWLPIDLMWDEPQLVRFLDRLSTFCRHVWFDPRGRGASDLLDRVEDRLVESTVDDMVTVMDALGWQQAAVLNLGLGGLLFAATHPERIKALVSVPQAIARIRRAADFPEGLSDEAYTRALGLLERGWGTGLQLEFWAPGTGRDPRFVRWFGRCERLASTPMLALERAAAALNVDMRQALPTISAPTIVINRRDSGFAAASRYAARHIAGAKYVELPGSDLFFTGETGPMLDAIEEFLTGRLHPPDVGRVLATVLFTDVVGSTKRAAQLGDRRWRDVLANHDTAVRSELERFRGREIKTIGDGFLATFDGPGRAIRCTCAIQDALRSLDIDVRAGLHTGEVELVGDDIAGIAVHIGQRVSGLAAAGEVLVSSTVKDLVAGSDFVFVDRGAHELKGVPGSWKLFAVEG
jgi:class 3 adenylate cyclase